MTIRRVGTVILMIGMMIATVFVRAADKPGEPAKKSQEAREPSNTRMAQCILRISYDPSVLPLSEEFLNRLIRSSGILGKATKEHLGTDAFLPDITLTDIGSGGDMMPVAGMEGGMMGMGMGGGMMGGMGMGGFGGGGMSGFAGGGGESVSMSVPPQPPVPPVPPAVSSESGDNVAVQSSSSPDQLAADALRRQAEKQMQEAQQRAREAEMRAREAQRMAEQLQSRYGGGRSSGYPRPDLIDLNTPSVGLTKELLLHFEMIVNEDHAPLAIEAMETVIDLLRDALQRDFEAYKERMIRRIDLAQKQATIAENEVRQLQETLRDLSSSGELRRDQIMIEISGNQEKMRQIRLDNELNRVMEDNLNLQIEEARKKADQQIAGDPVLKDLQKLLDISRQRVDATEKMMAAGQSGQNALQDAMEKLARANIELAQRKEVLGAYVGVEQINDLLQRLNDISLRKVQSEIQLTQLEQRIRELRGNLEKAVDSEILSLRLDLAREKLSGALRRADYLRDFQPEPPIVEAIGAD